MEKEKQLNSWKVTLLDRIYSVSQDVVEREIKKLVVRAYILKTGSQLPLDYLMLNTKIEKPKEAILK